MSAGRAAVYTQQGSGNEPSRAVARAWQSKAGSVATIPGEGQQPAPGTPEFLHAVRRAAGWRVSPREIEPVVEALRRTRAPVTPERVAEVVSALRGERSARQRRHPELWRLLGAYLALQGKPAHPEAQRAFIGRCRRLLGDQVSDLVLLSVATEVGATGKPLDARFVARATRWLLEQGVTGAEAERLEELLPQAIEFASRAIASARRPPPGRQGGDRLSSRRPRPPGQGPTPPRRQRW